MNHELNESEVIDFVESRNRHHLNRKQLKIDIERYQSYLDGSDLSNEQKVEFLNALWTVIVAFVDLGYGVHPVQAGGADIIDFPTPRSRCSNVSQKIGETAHV
ncbi:hypothetical protein [Celeribacter halophilus]|uniref:hypothetical protein n=1 Tax=Celeribacter halophilus TaxID=576117 RepID=UPI001C091B60|nr:hypothetical protein [Celeribacter halophilus]MBU2888246.1 hypothetical protein [Celeribacter halophilus]MDO6512281.1 hypothetical protein [Celeribacter halophilus]